MLRFKDVGLCRRCSLFAFSADLSDAMVNAHLSCMVVLPTRAALNVVIASIRQSVVLAE